MVNDFMRNVNKVSLDGEVVSFSNTLPLVDVKKDVVETPILEEIVVDTDNEEVVDEMEDEEITESTEETCFENVDETIIEE